MTPARWAMLMLLSCAAPACAEPMAIPIHGPRVASLAPLDEAIVAFMAEHRIDASTLAVSRDGRILYTQGYGWGDPEHHRPVTPDTPMRLASVSKPITAALVRRLIDEGKLTPQSRVIEFLKLTLPENVDPRLRLITVDHLLNHRGGWDRAAGFDPMFHDAAIRKRLNLDRVPTADDIIQYMLTQPLQFDPGERDAYSNFGYCLLGRIVERAAGQPFIACVRQHIAEPLDMSSLTLARTDPKRRDPREPSYPTGSMTLYTERMDAHGGMIANAADLCRFLEAYRLDGRPMRKRARYDGVFFGSMPGTTAMVRQRPDGLNLAVLCNRQFPGHARLKDVLDRAVEQVGDWPR